MNEVDTTLLPILQDVGCRFGTDVTGVAQFGADDIVQACSILLHAIDDTNKFAVRLPPSQAARVRLTSKIATIIKELGFAGDLGYQNLLYPNEKDMRKLLIFLVDKLPKTSMAAATDETPGGEGGQLLTSIQQWASQRWNPFARVYKRPTQPVRTVRLECGDRAHNRHASAVHYYETYQSPVSTQANDDRACLVSSVIEQNTLELARAALREREWAAGGGDIEKERVKRETERNNLIADSFRVAMSRAAAMSSSSKNAMVDDMLSSYAQQKSTLLSRRTQFEQEGDDVQVQVVEEGKVTNVTEGGDVVVEEDEDAIRAKQEAELDAIKAQIQQLRESIQQWEQAADAAAAEAHHIHGELGVVLEETKALEDAYKVKKRTLDLLPNAEENLQKLQEIAAASAQKLVKLAQEWETHRAPLIAKYRRKKQEMQDRKEEARTKLEQIKTMRAEMKQMALDTRDKDALHKQVLEEYNKLPKSINRQVYVRRIMDIVKNLERQKVDIRRVLVDVRQVQKDINSVGETNKRSFAVTDEMIFQYANQMGPSGKGSGGGGGQQRDPHVTKSYKYLVNLRQGFDALVEMVETMGKTKNEIRELTSRIDALEARNVSSNMERIKNDLNEVKKENSALAAKLQGVQQQQQ